MTNDSYREEVIGIKQNLDDIYDECVNQQQQLHGNNSILFS